MHRLFDERVSIITQAGRRERGTDVVGFDARHYACEIGWRGRF